MTVVKGLVTVGSTGGAISSPVAIDAVPNRVLYAAFVNYFNSDNVSGITFNGVALTKIAEAGLTFNRVGVSFWRLINPPSGTFTLAGLNPSSRPILWTAWAMLGVNQTTPEGTPAIHDPTAGGVSSSLSVTAPSDAFVLDALGILDDTQTTNPPTILVGQSQDFSQTRSYNSSADDLECGMSSKPGAGGATSMGWTWDTSHYYAHVAIPVLAAAGAPGSGRTPSLMTMGMG